MTKPTLNSGCKMCWMCWTPSAWLSIMTCVYSQYTSQCVHTFQSRGPKAFSWCRMEMNNAQRSCTISTITISTISNLNNARDADTDAIQRPSGSNNTGLSFSNAIGISSLHSSVQVYYMWFEYVRVFIIEPTSIEHRACTYGWKFMQFYVFRLLPDAFVFCPRWGFYEKMKMHSYEF